MDLSINMLAKVGCQMIYPWSRLTVGVGVINAPVMTETLSIDLVWGYQRLVRLLQESDTQAQAFEDRNIMSGRSADFRTSYGWGDAIP